jgi:hypothetical protein
MFWEGVKEIARSVLSHRPAPVLRATSGDQDVADRGAGDRAFGAAGARLGPHPQNRPTSTPVLAWIASHVPAIDACRAGSCNAPLAQAVHRSHGSPLILKRAVGEP